MPETKKPGRSAAQGKPKADHKEQPKRRRHDWEAIERDYRTGQFTLKELERKHGAGFSDIAKRAKRDGWQKDLRSVIRQATSAAVVAETTKAIAKEALSGTVGIVIAAAEANSQVVLGHVARARELQTDSSSARTKLMALADTAATINEAAKLAAALESLARTTKTLVEIERKALNLDDPAEQPKPPAPSLADLQPGEEVDAYRAWVNG